MVLIGSLALVGENLEELFSSWDKMGKNTDFEGGWDYPPFGTMVGTCPICGWHGASYTATPFNPAEYSWTYPDATPIDLGGGYFYTYDGPTWEYEGDFYPTWVLTTPP